MSVNEVDEVFLFIAKMNNEKYLFLLYEDIDDKLAAKFEGSVMTFNGSDNFLLKKCAQTTYNRQVLQRFVEFTNPEVIGLANSFGFGDRLGLSNPAHVRSLNGSDFQTCTCAAIDTGTYKNEQNTL